MTIALSSMPTWASFTVLLIGWNLLALFVMLVSRRWSSAKGATSGPAVVNAWATCAGALTALLFAFTIVTLWNQLVRAESNADDEVSALRAVARDVLPSQVALVSVYAHLTLEEWPRLCGGTPNAQAEGALLALERSAQPRSEKYGDNLFQMLGTLEDMRNRRWQLSTSAVPSEIWVALVVLAGVLLVVLGIAMPESPGTHLILMLAVGTALGTLFWVTVVLEYPFCGSSGIRPNEILAFLQNHGL